jgi:hypothetical protein
VDLLGILKDLIMQCCILGLIVTLALFVTLPFADAQPPGKVFRVGILGP